MTYRKYIDTIENTDPLENGGGIVLRNTDKTTYSLIYFLEIPDREQWEPRRWWVHRIDLELDYITWVDLSELSRNTGVAEADYRDALTGGPVAIAQVILDACYYYGFAEFDECPLVMTKTEINKFWGKWV